MSEQFENPEVKKLEDKTISNPSAQKRIDRIAEEIAEKPAKTEQEYDREKGIFEK